MKYACECKIQIRNLLNNFIESCKREQIKNKYLYVEVDETLLPELRSTIYTKFR